MDKIKILEIDDTSYECSSIIEFTSLIKILFKLSEKQKYLENKIDLINNRVDEKENRLNNLEIQVTGESKSEDLKIVKSIQNVGNTTNQKISPKPSFEHSSKDIKNIKIDEKNDLKSDAKSEIKSDAKDEIKSEIKSELKSELKDELKNEMKIEEKDDITEENLVNPDMIKKLFKRVKDNEKKIFELSKSQNTFDKKINKNSELIDSNIKKIEKMSKHLDELEKKFADFKTDYENVKVKVEDFNIYDIFKGEGGTGGNLDVAKGLVMALETKVFKKFALLDDRYKTYDKDLFKIKEETKNNSIIVDGMKHITEKNNQQLKDLSKNHEEFCTQANEKFDLLENELNNIRKDGVINGENKMNELIQRKITENEIKFTNIIQKQISDKELNYQKSESLKSLKEEQANNRSNIKRFNDIEKMIRESLEEIGAKNIKERIQNLENEIMKRFTIKDGIDLKNKMLVLEEEIKDESMKIETLQQQWEKMRNDIVQLVKKIEYLNSEYAKLSFKKVTSFSEKPDISIDLLKYLEKTEYINNKNDVNNKFEKVRLAIENLGRNLENILNSLSHTVNEYDLINFQGVIKTTLDELKLIFNKKFADKIETNKTLKYLETQLKSVMEFSNKKVEGADNWLLAKKPLNNYLCASCESVIRGELDKKADYIPWNKYPSREDKTYRMGHGFSRMLQMVNDDIMRSTNTDNINSNLFINSNINSPTPNFNISNTKDNQKDDENNSNSQLNNNNNNNNILANIKLPKVKNKNSLNTNQSLNNFDINLQKEKNKDEIAQRMMTSPYDDFSQSTSNINRPQILKIYKLNKNSAITNNTNNINSEAQQFGIQTVNVSQKKIKPNEDIIKLKK